MTRHFFAAVLLMLVGAGSQPLLADENAGQQANSGATQSNSNEQQTSAGGTSQKQVESGPALPAPDGSKTSEQTTAAQSPQNRTVQGNVNPQAQPRSDREGMSNDSPNDVRDSRRENGGTVRTESRDRSDIRDYRMEPPAGERERSYLSRSRRELPVYFGAEFDSQTDGVALVKRVDQGSPADRAGLRRDDMVLSLNGEKVSSADDALSILASMRAGDRLDVEYSRQAHGRAVLADSRGGAVASRSIENGFDEDRTYDGSRRGDYNSRYESSRNDSSRNDSSRDRPRTEWRGLGIFRRR